MSPEGKEKDPLSKLFQSKRGLLATSLLTLAVLLLAAIVRIHPIAMSMPYPRHIDEHFVLDSAGDMLRTGDPNPHFFIYPSLPIYLSAASLYAGFIAFGGSNGIEDVADIGSTTFPYYTFPDIVWPTKLLFMAMSLAAMVLMGFVGYRFLRRPALLFLVPAIATLSARYFGQSQQYVNVDIAATFFVSLLYAWCFTFLNRQSMLHKAVFPGILVGLATGCKYHLALGLLLPATLLLLYPQKKRLLSLVILGGVSFLTFLVTTPYALLDFPAFWSDMVWSARHYSGGHIGYDGPTGLPQFLFYISTLIADYGILAGLLAAAGLLFAFRRDWRLMTALLSVPVGLLLLFSTQTVHFTRNVLFVYLVFALLAAIGIVCFWFWLVSAVGKGAGYWWKRALVTLGLAALCLWFFPVSRIVDWMRIGPDSRNLGTEWIRASVPAGSVLMIVPELEFSVEQLEADYHVVPLVLPGLGEIPFLDLAAERANTYFVIPEYGYDPRFPGAAPRADDLNRYREWVQPLTSFGANPVLVNRVQAIPSGDPAFSIGVVRPLPDSRAREIACMAATVLPLYLNVDNVVDLITEAGRLVVTLRSEALSLPPGRYEGVLALSKADSLVAAPDPTTELTVLTDNGTIVGHFLADDFLREMKLNFTLDKPYNGALLVRLDLPPGNRLLERVDLLGNLWKVDPANADCVPSGIKS